MRATYQEITDKMRAAFFDACGEKPEDLPELDARFRSVATELYALSVFGDHVQSQVFADTARGADLDRHAADVGLQRKGADIFVGASSRGGGDRTGRHGVFCGRAALFAVCHHQGVYHSCWRMDGGCAGRFFGQDHCP